MSKLGPKIGQRSWGEFSTSIRNIVRSANKITEILEGVLASDKKLLAVIRKENASNKAVAKLIRVANRITKTQIGRAAVTQLSSEYQAESGWPTDDISLRRAYAIYCAGELGKHLPALHRRMG